MKTIVISVFFAAVGFIAYRASVNDSGNLFNHLIFSLVANALAFSAWKQRPRVLLDPQIFCLVVAVTYLMSLEGMFSIGMRQIYSVTFSFFVQGFLADRIEQSNQRIE